MHHYGSSSSSPAKVVWLLISVKHLINAMVERDTAKLSRVGVIRLASEGFTQTTPPFIEFPADLRNGKALMLDT